MSKPTVKDLAKVKRLARYLQTAPRLTLQSCCEHGQGDEIHAYVDADWAGCRASRRSTSGGLLTVGGMVVKSWSSTQGSIATSSGESEFYALVRGAAEALGLQAALADLGWAMRPKVFVDSSAAKAVSGRVGLGKTRHIEVRYLWVQQTVRRKPRASGTSRTFSVEPTSLCTSSDGGGGAASAEGGCQGYDTLFSHVQSASAPS